MENQYIELILDVFDEVNHRAQVKSNVTFGLLIEEIIKEFDDALSPAPELYRLYKKGAREPLNNNHTLGDLSLLNEDHLILSWGDRAPFWDRKIISSHSRGFLIESGSGMRFPIDWQPAIIGRLSGKEEEDNLLCANLLPFANGKKVSRQHASITENKGAYTLTVMSEDNPVSLSDKPLDHNMPISLSHGDHIQLISSGLTLIFEQEKQDAS